MQINSIKIRPYKDIVPPGILLEIDINRHKNQEAIMEVSGFLKLEDNIILAKLYQYSQNNDYRK